MPSKHTLTIAKHAQLVDVSTPHVDADIADITDAWIAAAAAIAESKLSFDTVGGHKHDGTLARRMSEADITFDTVAGHKHDGTLARRMAKADLSDGAKISYISSGSYTGDSTENRAIAHGLGVKPKAVFILDTTGRYWFRMFEESAGYTWIQKMEPGATRRENQTLWTDTYFYVGRYDAYFDTANYTGYVYYWVAFG